MNSSKFLFSNKKSLIDDLNLKAVKNQQQNIIDSVVSQQQVTADQIELLLEADKKVIEELKNNYDKLSNIYLLKEQELRNSKAEAEKLGRYNRIMLIIAIISACITVLQGVMNL